MVNHHMSHSSTFSLVKFIMIPLRCSLLMTIQRLPNSPLIKMREKKKSMNQSKKEKNRWFKC
ncbi:hypothetical protein HanRHA438_Chr01g0018671 [Helianthus annuus]|nr:hypothetical protein HanRHA438_Chr01g0018671 [Helianthus annuus]